MHFFFQQQQHQNNEFTTKIHSQWDFFIKENMCVFYKRKKWVIFNNHRENRQKKSWTIVKRTLNCSFLFSVFCFVLLHCIILDFDWSATKCNEFRWQFKKQSIYFCFYFFETSGTEYRNSTHIYSPLDWWWAFQCENVKKGRKKISAIFSFVHLIWFYLQLNCCDAWCRFWYIPTI